MKRDMDLARKILFAIEKSTDDMNSSIQLPDDEYDTLHISHHVRLLKEGGLIHAIEASHSLHASIAWVPHSLTWQGHDFLDLIRDPQIWNEIIAVQDRFGIDLPTDFILELAASLLKGKLAEEGEILAA